MSPLRIAIWSIYYAPEPTGIAPVATGLARGLAERGHEVSVVTSHPHYPDPSWGRSAWPKRVVRDGLPVTELPIYTSRRSTARRALSELSYGAGSYLHARRAPTVDVVIVVVPSVLALPAASRYLQRTGTPFVIWLQDIVSGLARSTGIAGGGRVAALLEELERRGFERAEGIVTISSAFRRRLVGRGVEPGKIEHIHQAAGEWPQELPEQGSTGPTALAIGNVGLTQGLDRLAAAFQRSSELTAMGAELRVTGHGVGWGELAEVAEAPTTTLLGIVDRATLRKELAGARVGIVSQRPGVADFNLPSKMATYMANGLPVVAIVDPDTEVAEIVRESRGGWVLDSRDLDLACGRLASILAGSADLARASDLATSYARSNFDPDSATAAFEGFLERLVRERGAIAD